MKFRATVTIGYAPGSACSAALPEASRYADGFVPATWESREPRVNNSRMSQQDVPNTWLSDAVASGARVLTGLHVDKVLAERQPPVHESNSARGRGSSLSHRRSNRAVGVLATSISKGQQPHPRLPKSGGAKLVIR